jgi:epoxyqueuosine reductase
VTLTQDILAHARTLGFDLAGVARVGPPPHAGRFTAWLADGYHGEMAYLAARAAERVDPSLYAPGARSLIVLAANYNPAFPQQPVPRAPSGARIARYATLADYHDVLKPRLYDLDAFIRQHTGRQELGKVFVDSAPVLERDFAERAGLGFIGRNTCLIAPELGSWTFLAGLMVTEELEAGSWKLGAGRWGAEAGSPRSGASEGCGRCTRCLDACPTRAFVAPYVLDARRCISYLTIELRGLIPRDLRPSVGNWVFGCDVCQEVCPYNRLAPTTAWPVPVADRTLSTPPLRELLTLDEAGFRVRFHGTPVMRAKRRGLVRNACVAAGNAGDTELVPNLITLLADPEPLVRGHAAWALGRSCGTGAARALAQASLVETVAWVRAEIAAAEL